jgi:hypothetical protein
MEIAEPTIAQAIGESTGCCQQQIKQRHMLLCTACGWMYLR